MFAFGEFGDAGITVVAMQVHYTNRALKALRKMDAQVRTRIVDKINVYASDPMGQANNVAPLRQRPGHRLRVGAYRVIFSIGDDGDVTVLTVLDVGHRKEIYDG